VTPFRVSTADAGNRKAEFHGRRFNNPPCLHQLIEFYDRFKLEMIAKGNLRPYVRLAHREAARLTTHIAQNTTNRSSHQGGFCGIAAPDSAGQAAQTQQLRFSPNEVDGPSEAEQRLRGLTSERSAEPKAPLSTLLGGSEFRGSAWTLLPGFCLYLMQN
jgi:hypothetical protein